MEKENLILKLISGEENLILKASDGSRLIYQSGETFTSFLDPKFVALGLNKKGITTTETKIQIYEIAHSGDFIDIFKSLPGIWNQKWLSQNQIIDFCEQLSKYLYFQGYAVIFICKIDEMKEVDEENPQNNLVAVSAHLDASGLSAEFYRLSCYSSAWHAINTNRFVIPQLNN